MINNKYKVGVGIVTCDREEYLSQSLSKFIEYSRDVDYFCLVNDGDKLSESSINLFNSIDKIEKDLIQHFPKHQSVGKCKNQILKKCVENDCDFIYLIEDDMILKSSDVFHAYAKAMNTSGIFHMNFALHGTANLKKDGTKNERMVVKYDNGVELGLYPNLVGSFNVYHRNVIKHVGYYDEKYKNAFEHVDHTYSVVLANLHPPFWWFVDLFNSDYYIQEIEGSIQNSTRTGNAKENEIRGFEHFRKKYGIAVNLVENKKSEDVKKYLKFFEENYANSLDI